METEIRKTQARLVGHLEIGSCPRCGEPVRWKGRGRKPRWCSQTCRVRAKEARRAAREGERPLMVVDGPARPANADEWVELLTDEEHERLLIRVLRRLAEKRAKPEYVPDAADEMVEAMFKLPAGSGERLRKGLPLPDANERAEAQRAQQARMSPPERDRSQVAEVERAAYSRGRSDGYREGRVDGIEWSRRQVLRERERAASEPSPAQSGMTRQQRRAAERAEAKRRRKQGPGIHIDPDQLPPGLA